MAVVSNVEIRVNAKNAIKQLDLIQKKTGNLPGTFNKSAAASKKLSGGMAAAGAAATGMGFALKSALAPLLAIGVAVGAVTKSFSIMGQRQADVAALENGLRNLGVTGDQVFTALQTKADAFGKVTLFSEEDYTRAATQLTSFTNISVSAFDRVINVAGDVAQVMNQDVNSAVTQLAKALNAPTQNLSALSRSGIQFTEQQKEQIKALEASGQLQAAQGLILAELERQYKGAAVAAGSAGLAGALDGLSEVANDAFEAFGKILEPIAVPIIQGITNAIQFMSDTWAYISGVIFPEIVAAAQPLTDALMRVFSAVDIEGFGTILQNIVIQGFKNLTVVIGNVSSVLGFVIDRFVDLSNTPVFKFIADQVERLAGMLGLTTDRVGEFNNAQKMSQTEADKILAAQTQIKSAADETNKSQKEINATLKQQTALTEQAARSQTKALTDNLSLAEARYSTEKQLLNSAIRQAEAAGDIKTVYELKNTLAQIDYDISVQRIRTEVRKLEIAKELAVTKQKELQVALALTAEGSKEESRLKRAVELQKEAVKQAELNLSRGRALAKEQFKTAKAIKEGATAASKLELHAAKTAASTQAAATASNSFANNMERGAAAASKAAASTQRAASAARTYTVSVSTNMTKITKQLEEQYRLQEFTKRTGLPEEYLRLADQAERFRKEIQRVTVKDAFGRILNGRMIARLNDGLALTGRRMADIAKQAGLAANQVSALYRLGPQAVPGYSVNKSSSSSSSTGSGINDKYNPYANSSLPKYGSGGYVNGPQRALIGESGSEYVIPSSKMAAAMERYAAGKRGDEVVPNGNDTQVNVSTGPVMQMNGQNYVTQSDFEKGLRSTVNQVMTTLRRSPNTRAAVGI